MHREKIEQILLAYGFPKEIVTAAMIHYKKKEAIVRLLHSDTYFFDIVAGVL